MIVSELVSRLGFQVDPKGAKQFDSTLNNLRDRLVDFQHHINATGNNVGAMMKGVAAGVGFTLANMAYAASAAVAGAVVATGKAFIEAGDDLAAIEARLKAATGSVQDGAQAYELLYQSARQTGVAVNETSRAFMTFYPAMQKAGMGIGDTVTLLDGLQKGMITAGTSAQRVGAVLTQLGQAVNANNFGGDELKSFLENAPPAIIDAFAKAINTTREQLKKLGSEGKLTNAQVIPGLLAASRASAETFGDTAATLSLAWRQAGVAVTNFLGKLNKTLGVNRALIKIVDALGDAFDWLGRRVDDLDRLIQYLGGLRNILQTIVSFILAYYAPAIIAAFGAAAVGLVRGFAQSLILLRAVLWTTAAAVWANLGPILAVGAAFLAIEDFITWLRGGNSVMGDLFGKPEEAWANIKSWLDRLDAYVNGIIDNLAAKLKSIWAEFTKNLPPAIRAYLGVADATGPAGAGGAAEPTPPGIAQYEGNLLSSLGTLWRNTIGGKLADMGLWNFRNDTPDGQQPAPRQDEPPTRRENLTQTMGRVVESLELLTQNLPMPRLTEMGLRNAATNYNNANQTNNITVPIQITAPGSDPASIASASESGVRRGIEDSTVRLGGSLALGLGIAMPRAEMASQ